MARKKKTKSNDIVNNGYISYSGNIKIELMHGDKVYKTIKVHNTGRQALFSYIASCLIGNFRQTGAPTYLMGYNADLTQTEINFDTATQTLSSLLPYVSVRTENIASGSTCYPGSKAIFTFLIPYTSVLSASSTNVFAIYNEDNYNTKNSPSAFYKLDSSITLDPNSNMRITWTMIVCNKE